MINWSNVWGTFKSQLENYLLPKSGGTMTGGLILKGNPTETNEAATKGYVDNSVRCFKGGVTFEAKGTIVLGKIPNYDSTRYSILAKGNLWGEGLSSPVYMPLSPTETAMLWERDNAKTAYVSIDTDGNVSVTLDYFASSWTNKSYDIELIITPTCEITLDTK